MALQLLSDLATRGLSPLISTIIISAIVALSLPLLLHLYIYRTRASFNLPSFLVIGPSGSGKTSLVTLFERGAPSDCHVSQEPLIVEVSLPVSTVAASTQYRSVNDPSNSVHRKFLLVDTPGHGKLRHFALENITNPQHLKGVVFVLDATSVSDGSSGLTEAAEYLHDILLTLQKRHTSSKTSKGPAEMPFLIAPNKLDLFTALPPKLVKTMLENEITKLRNTRSRGLLDSAVGVNEDTLDERDVLGGGGEGKFDFGLMEEYNVHVDMIGGNVLGADGADVSQWWAWIGKYL